MVMSDLLMLHLIAGELLLLSCMLTEPYRRYAIAMQQGRGWVGTLMQTIVCIVFVCLWPVFLLTASVALVQRGKNLS
jgi:hypothetical protein